MRRIHVLVLAPFTALLAGCQTTGLGDAPRKLVSLYDMAEPAGLIEIELERDGSVREMEAEVPVDALPASVRRAAAEQLPDGQITGGEREITLHGESWEVKMVAGGVDWEFIIDESTGEVHEIEQAIDPADAPDGVVGNAAGVVRSYTGEEGSLKSVEKITRHDLVEYHVKRMVNGASYKVIVDANGAVKRTVREHRAEIEVQLR